MIFDLLYNLIIMPLIYIYELVFGLTQRIAYSVLTGNEDFFFYGILMVSIVVNILSMPLYIAADRIQKQEREKQNSMSKVVKHINRTFKGDEKLMILNAYYRLENYNPVYSLRTALPLLLQIPFFMAAYIFFVNAKALIGVPIYSFPLIRDLSKPDGMLNINGLVINVLPVIMTIINLISALIYTKGLGIKDKIQPFVLAIVFLTILYDSPSALVIYWTINNIFSLLKSIISIIVEKIKKYISYKKSIENNQKLDNKYNLLGIISLFNIFVIMGLLIPTNLISASPTEFIINDRLPYSILINTIVIYIGFFLWELLFFKMSSGKVRIFLTAAIFSLSIYLLLNHISFINNFGVISQNLIYSSGFKRFSNKDLQKDFAIVVFCFIILLLFLKFYKHIYKISIILLLSLLSVSFYNLNIIYREISIYQNTKNVNDSVIEDNNYNGKLKLSKDGKNVIVLMLDKSCGIYIDYVFNDRTELKKVYDGFTFYDNAISCASGTIVGSTPIFGGYDYLPQNANKRKDVLLVDKHNEALKIMPINFSNNGYDCVVANLPYENYDDRSRESIFADMENVSKISLISNAEKFIYNNMDIDTIYSTINRKFVIYSVMKTFPVAFKGIIYNDGLYLAQGFMRSLHIVRSYYAFDNMINKCKVENDSSNNFWMIDNEITHNSDNAVFPYGDFSPAAPSDIDGKYPDIFDSKGMIFNGQYAQFSAEAAAYLQIGRFLSFLKENNIYDNTRIVIASDHGCRHDVSLDKSKDVVIPDSDNRIVGVSAYNCVLFFKDFNAHGEIVIDHSFMVNADTPLLAMKDIIDKPINPYLDKPIDDNDRNVDSIDIISGGKGHNGPTYINDYTFDYYSYSCKPLNIFDKNSWFIKKEVE